MPVSPQTVYVHCAALVNGAEMEYDPAFHILRSDPVSPVPEILVRLQSAPDSGQLAFRGEGDKYLALPSFRLLFAGRRKGIIPFSVEVDK